MSDIHDTAQQGSTWDLAKSADLALGVLQAIQHGGTRHPHPQVIAQTIEKLQGSLAIAAPDLSHDLIKTNDPDAVPAICDANGEVVLGYCRRCQQAEADLAPTCPAALARSMESAPRNDTMVRLLVVFHENDIDDGPGPFWTIGANRLDSTGEDVWTIAGWDWCNDRICTGRGRPIGWLPLDPAADAAAAGDVQRLLEQARADLAIMREGCSRRLPVTRR